MTDHSPRASRVIPVGAVALSLAALALPTAGALLAPEALGEYGALLWLLALVPAFLFAYYRGWKGVAAALGLGMGTLAVTQVAAFFLQLQVPQILPGVVVAYVAIAMGIGWVSELLHRERHEVEDLAFTDLLTGLPNRRHARVFLDNEFAAAQRGRRLSIVLFDLDNFKQYNDRFGHHAGDEALQAFADVLSRTTRRMNLSARWGGEEFIAILAGSESEGAGIFADRVRMTLAAHRLGDDFLTTSAGVAEYDDDMRSVDELVSAADRALYQAKREGRNRVVLHGAPERTKVPAAEEEDLLEPVAAQPGAGGVPQADGEALPNRITGFGRGRKALIVEDDLQVRSLIADYLRREGFTVSEAGEAIEGVRALRTEHDLVLTDIRLPGASGNELVSAVKSRWPATQVIVVTGLQEAHSAGVSLNVAADRYLFKPFGMPELRAHLLHAMAQRDRTLAERRFQLPLSHEELERTIKVREEVVEGLRALVEAVEVRDPFTRGSSALVAEVSVTLAREIDPEGALLDPEAVRLGCELRDLGKISVPDAILNKQGTLSEEEVERVKKHPQTGRRILEPLLDDDMVLAIVSWHHERWDGTGYPDGLAGESIPLAARVVSLADALVAMASDRAWRRGRPWPEAVRRIQGLAGTQFDPDIIPAFESVVDEIEEIFHEGRPAVTSTAE